MPRRWPTETALERLQPPRLARQRARARERDQARARARVGRGDHAPRTSSTRPRIALGARARRTGPSWRAARSPSASTPARRARRRGRDHGPYWSFVSRLERAVIREALVALAAATRSRPRACSASTATRCARRSPSSASGPPTGATPSGDARRRSSACAASTCSSTTTRAGATTCARSSRARSRAARRVVQLRLKHTRRRRGARARARGRGAHARGGRAAVRERPLRPGAARGRGRRAPGPGRSRARASCPRTRARGCWSASRPTRSSRCARAARGRSTTSRSGRSSRTRLEARPSTRRAGSSCCARRSRCAGRPLVAIGGITRRERRGGARGGRRAPRP